MAVLTCNASDLSLAKFVVQYILTNKLGSLDYFEGMLVYTDISPGECFPYIKVGDNTLKICSTPTLAPRA